MFSCINADEGIKLPLQKSLSILHEIESICKPCTLHIPEAAPHLLLHYLELYISAPKVKDIGFGG